MSFPPPGIITGPTCRVVINPALDECARYCGAPLPCPVHTPEFEQAGEKTDAQDAATEIAESWLYQREAETERLSVNALREQLHTTTEWRAKLEAERDALRERLDTTTDWRARLHADNEALRELLIQADNVLADREDRLRQIAALVERVYQYSMLPSFALVRIASLAGRSE